jgi:hypothetical protein
VVFNAAGLKMGSELALTPLLYPASFLMQQDRRTSRPARFKLDVAARRVKNGVRASSDPIAFLPERRSPPH